MSVLSQIIIVLLFLFPAYADTASEQYQEIQQKIKEQQKKLRQAEELESSFLNELEAVNRKYDETRKELGMQQAKIQKTKTKIQYVKDDINLFVGMLSRQRKYLKRKLSSMQRYGNDLTNLFTAIFSSRSFDQMMRNMRYLEKVADYDYRQITLYEENLQKLDKKKKELDELYSQVKEEEQDLRKREDELKAKKTRKEVLLASVRSQKNGFEKMLGELSAASNRLKEMLEQRETNTYSLTKFALLKGRLPWPVDGQVAIPYGSYRDPQFNTPVFRRGIYIRADDDSVARSVYSGRVVFADWFKGYGKVIIISHGSGYHSVYANLNEIFFKPGDIVKKWEPVGRVGESGTINAPALYFEMRYKGKPLNPLQWLARKK
jgi:septal ring factor EnvC (AmiA/AmiB activator)